MRDEQAIPRLPALLAALVLCTHAPSIRAEDEQDKAIELYQQAVELAKENRYDDAIPLFEEAFEMGAPPVALYNIARCYESLGKFEMAVDYYQRYVDAPGVEDAEDVKPVIKELKAKPSPITLATEPPEADVSEVMSDTTKNKLGTTPLEFSAKVGSHTYLIEREGYKSKKITLKTGLGKEFDLEIILTEEEKKPGKGPKKPREPADALGLYFEAGGGAVLHVYKGVDLEAGADVSAGLGWRFAHRSDTGFAVGLRASFRPYRLAATGEDRTYMSLITTILAVPAFQLRLHERLSLEASVPLGMGVMTPIDAIPSTTEIALVGGTIEQGGLPLFDVGVGVALRIMIVSGLYVTVEPIHFHVLVPTTKWRGEAKVLTDIDFSARIGFEL